MTLHLHSEHVPGCFRCELSKDEVRQPLRALTVRQPHAWAIIHGGKDVENRTRNIAGKYRGPVAIHAGLTLDEGAIDDFTLRRAWHLAGMPHRPTSTPGIFEPWLHNWNAEDDEQWLPLGAVIGVVDLVDVHWADPFEGCHRPDSSWECSAWADTGCYHLALRNRRPLPRPIPWRGRLGLWTVPDELEALIREQVTP